MVKKMGFNLLRPDEGMHPTETGRNGMHVIRNKSM
jgi:hypothetical protein